MPAMGWLPVLVGGRCGGGGGGHCPPGAFVIRGAFSAFSSSLCRLPAIPPSTSLTLPAQRRLLSSALLPSTSFPPHSIVSWSCVISALIDIAVLLSRACTVDFLTLSVGIARRSICFRVFACNDRPTSTSVLPQHSHRSGMSCRFPPPPPPPPLSIFACSTSGSRRCV